MAADPGGHDGVADLDGTPPSVESVNAALKGAFVDLGRGFMRVRGQAKATVLLGFTLAAYNVDSVRAFRAKHRIASDDEPEVEYPPVKVRQPKRRRGTWSDVIGESPPD